MEGAGDEGGIGVALREEAADSRAEDDALFETPGEQSMGETECVRAEKRVRIIY